jgi:CBS domain-containing protein
VSPDSAEGEKHTRNYIALGIVIAGFLGIAVLAVTAMFVAENKDETVRLIFASIVPLLGTWVGAVLAFYFSRDNLQAGSDTTLSAVRAAGGLDVETLVSAVMIPINRIRPREDVADEAAAKALTLASLHQKMRSSGQGRVPVLDLQQRALYVVHEPDIDKYAQAHGLSASALPEDATLQQLLDDAAIAAGVSGFVAVSPTATLGEARAAMAAALMAKDAFVTEDGQRTGRVLGWLTNSDLARSS